MQNNDTSSAGQTSAAKSARDRVGLLVNGMEAASAVVSIKAAEAAGVRQVWMTQSTPAPDALTILPPLPCRPAL